MAMPANGMATARQVTSNMFIPTSYNLLSGQTRRTSASSANSTPAMPIALPFHHFSLIRLANKLDPALL
jgi:hypothetical protein